MPRSGIAWTVGSRSSGVGIALFTAIGNSLEVVVPELTMPAEPLARR